MSRAALILVSGGVIAAIIFFLNGDTPAPAPQLELVEKYEATPAPIGVGIPGSTSTYKPSYYGGYDNYYDDDYRVIDRDEAIDEHWDEIKEYVDGSTEVEAYSYDSGNYYSLDADISNGEVDQVYFPNGGYLHSLGAEVDSGGSASGYDQEYRDWEFEVDDSLIDDAVEEWAQDNDYELDY